MERGKLKSGSREEIAREIVRELTATLITPVLALTPDRPPLTFLDLLWAGAYITESLVQFGQDPTDRELYEAARSRDAGRIEAVLYKRVLPIAKTLSSEGIPARVNDFETHDHGIY